MLLSNPGPKQAEKGLCHRSPGRAHPLVVSTMTQSREWGFEAPPGSDSWGSCPRSGPP